MSFHPISGLSKSKQKAREEAWLAETSQNFDKLYQSIQKERQAFKTLQEHLYLYENITRDLVKKNVTWKKVTGFSGELQKDASLEFGKRAINFCMEIKQQDSPIAKSDLNKALDLMSLDRKILKKGLKIILSNGLKDFSEHPLDSEIQAVQLDIKQENIPYEALIELFEKVRAVRLEKAIGQIPNIDGIKTIAGSWNDFNKLKKRTSIGQDIYRHLMQGIVQIICTKRGDCVLKSDKGKGLDRNSLEEFKKQFLKLIMFFAEKAGVQNEVENLVNQHLVNADILDSLDNDVINPIIQGLLESSSKLQLVGKLLYLIGQEDPMFLLGSHVLPVNFYLKSVLSEHLIHFESSGESKPPEKWYRLEATPTSFVANILSKVYSGGKYEGVAISLNIKIVVYLDLNTPTEASFDCELIGNKNIPPELIKVLLKMIQASGAPIKNLQQEPKSLTTGESELMKAPRITKRASVSPRRVMISGAPYPFKKSNSEDLILKDELINSTKSIKPAVVDPFIQGKLSKRSSEPQINSSHKPKRSSPNKTEQPLNPSSTEAQELFSLPQLDQDQKSAPTSPISHKKKSRNSHTPSSNLLKRTSRKEIARPRSESPRKDQKLFSSPQTIINQELTPPSSPKNLHKNASISPKTPRRSPRSPPPRVFSHALIGGKEEQKPLTFPSQDDPLTFIEHNLALLGINSTYNDKDQFTLEKGEYGKEALNTMLSKIKQRTSSTISNKDAERIKVILIKLFYIAEGEFLTDDFIYRNLIHLYFEVQLYPWKLNFYTTEHAFSTLIDCLSVYNLEKIIVCQQPIISLLDLLEIESIKYVNALKFIEQPFKSYRNSLDTRDDAKEANATLPDVKKLILFLQPKIDWIKCYLTNLNIGLTIAANSLLQESREEWLGISVKNKTRKSRLFEIIKHPLICLEDFIEVFSEN